MPTTYQKGQLIKLHEMPEDLLRAYLRKLKAFDVKAREGAHYDGKQVILYFTTVDEPHATFCVEGDEEKK